LLLVFVVTDYFLYACSSEAGADPSAGVCKLDISNRRGEVHTVPLQDAKECVQVMMIIQTRCAAPAASSSGASTSSAAAAVSTPSISSAASNLMSGGADMSPLVIGSSPVSRSGVSKSRRGGKRVSSASLNKENSVNERGSWGVAEDEGDCSGGESGPEESPKKKVRLSPRKGLQQRHNLASPVRRRQSDAMEEASEEREGRTSPNTFKKVSEPCPKYILAATEGANVSVFHHILQSGVQPVDMRQKMLQEVMLKKSQRAEKQQQPEECPAPEGGAAPEGSGASHLNKYRVMLKSGVPQQAVLQKMMLEVCTSVKIVCALKF
jgi:hypothetical protein